MAKKIPVLIKIEALYREIPEFECIPGCTDCCGPVPWAKAEWEACTDKRLQTTERCPYSLNGQCDIHEQRPFMCRLYGATTDPRITCPHGRAPKKPLSKERAAKLTEKYLRLVNE